MNPDEFLALARRLAAEPGQAERRTAVSRAYYAAFHVARRLLRDFGFTVPREERAHAYLYHRLSNAQPVEAAQAGAALDRLRSDRNRADYDLERPVDAVAAGGSVHAVELILHGLEMLRSEPVRSQVVDSIRAYERGRREVTWATADAMNAILGLDIGGANLKAAHTAGPARSVPFALWKRPHDLAAALAELVADFPPCDRLAVTMTGELCDCFATSRDGVLHILAALPPHRDIRVWTTAGRFVDVAAARADPQPCAAANWLALATIAGRFASDGPALVVDVGSTTSDLTPLIDGQPRPTGRTDPERLQSGELVYTGVRRTPACALLGLGGAAEFFATTHDVYLTLGEVPEDAADYDTADGRPAIKDYAHGRLARMLCGDAETLPRSATHALAERLALVQRQALGEVARRIAATHGPPRTLIVGGSGEFLARAAFADFAGPVVSLAERLGPGRSAAACAVAVAELAAASGR